MDIVAKEGCLKFNPRPGRGLNPGPSGWQSEILPTVPTLHNQCFNSLTVLSFFCRPVLPVTSGFPILHLLLTSLQSSVCDMMLMHCYGSQGHDPTMTQNGSMLVLSMLLGMSRLQSKTENSLPVHQTCNMLPFVTTPGMHISITSLK